MNLIIDIECIPAGEKITKDQLKIPGNIKKQETIDKWLENAEEEIEKEFVKRALIPHKCKVVCIAVKNEDVEDVWFGEEEEILKFFQAFVKRQTKSLYDVTFTGVNIRGYDLPILRQRAWKYNLLELSIALSQRELDLMDKFTGSKTKDYLVSKDEMCEFFGVTVKDEHDGSEVWGLYQAGDFDAIRAHCLNDVRKEYLLYKKMT